MKLNCESDLILVYLFLKHAHIINMFLSVLRKVRCFRTSISTDFQEVNVTNASLLCLQPCDIVAYIYKENWYIGIVEDVIIDHDDVKVHFYEPSESRTFFKISRDDKTWVPIKNILRKLTTATGRCHTITPQLCDEISQLFVEHCLSGK